MLLLPASPARSVPRSSASSSRFFTQSDVLVMVVVVVRCVCVCMCLCLCLCTCVCARRSRNLWFSLLAVSLSRARSLSSSLSAPLSLRRYWQMTKEVGSEGGAETGGQVSN